MPALTSEYMVSAWGSALTVKPYWSLIDSAKANPSEPVLATTVSPSRSSYVAIAESPFTAIWMPESKYGSEKSKISLRSSVIDMPAMTPATWLDCRAWRAASNPTDFTSTSNPLRSAMA